MKDVLKSIIKDGHKAEKHNVIERNLFVPTNSQKIISLIGARRSGKTYFLYQLMSKLPGNVERKDIIYINFEDERLNLKGEDLHLLIESYYELYPDNINSLYFFFDEIQNIENWEKFVRRIYDTISKNIFITGSSSKLLSKEIASSLRGRAVSYEIYPLMFDEYLRFKGVDTEDVYSTRNKSRIIQAFDHYLFEGGFPEIVHYDRELRTKTLHSYLDVMIYRDIIERYDVKNPAALKYFIKKSLANVSSYLSINKLYHELKSSGIKIGKDSIYEFMNYVQDCYLLFLVNIYSVSINIQNANDKKLYCIDNGLANNVSFKFSEDRGRLLENVAYLYLKANGNQIYYHSEKRECDFILLENSKVKTVIQITVELNTTNKEREIQGLVDAMRYFHLKEGVICTLDQTDEIRVENKYIKVLPVWKWILEGI